MSQKRQIMRNFSELPILNTSSQNWSSFVSLPREGRQLPSRSTETQQSSLHPAGLLLFTRKGHTTFSQNEKWIKEFYVAIYKGVVIINTVPFLDLPVICTILEDQSTADYNDSWGMQNIKDLCNLCFLYKETSKINKQVTTCHGTRNDNIYFRAEEIPITLWKPGKSQHFLCKGLGSSLICGCLCFEILLVSDTALISHCTIWGWAVTQAESMVML